jgi:signal transduction histidine kinase
VAKLNPRARIIRTIGDQLISGPEAAIIELVKNSYDADSEEVYVVFNKDELGRLSITVKDRGHGMTRSEILDTWFEPATNTKIKNSRSRSGNRRMLGAKGIGRFAVSRLGKISLMTSIAEFMNESESKLQRSTVYIDWSQFTADKYLSEIEIDIDSEILSSFVETGVEIEITDLRDVWSRRQLERLIIELRRLAHPQEDDAFNIRLDISCFSKNDDGFSGSDLFEEQNSDVFVSSDSSFDKYLIRPFAVGDTSDYKLVGDFDKDGRFSGSFQIQKGDGVVHNLDIAPPRMSEDEKACGPVSIKFNIYDREQDSIRQLFERMEINFEKIGIRRARKILTDMSGISISRNGFRIRPYGSPDHDWLELQAKRIQDPSKKLGSDQVSGYVVIKGEEESGIIERSSREGLELTPEFNRLKSLIISLLPHVEERRFKFREKAGLSRRPSTNTDKARDAAKLKRTTRALEKVPEEYREKLANALQKDTDSLYEMLDEVDNYQKVLQSRASLGLVVAEVIHEGRRLLDPMLSSIKELRSDWEFAFYDDEIGNLYRKHFPENIDMAFKGGKGLAALFKKLDPVSGRKRGRPGNFYFRTVLDAALSILAVPIDTNNINVSIDNTDSLVCYGYREDVQACLLNLFENAIFWLGSNRIEDRELEIRGESSKNNIKILVSNNGPLISDEYRDRIFDAGFSLKSDGTGLGLAIARETCRASKGDLKLDINDVNTTFIMEIPKGKKND